MFLGTRSQCTRSHQIGYWKSSRKKKKHQCQMLFYILKQRKGSRYRPMKHLLHLRSPLFVGILETTEIHDMNFTSFFWMSYFMTSTITSSRPRWLNRGKIQPSGMTNHPKAPLNLSAMCREPGQCPVRGPWGCQGGHFVRKGPVVGWKQLETTNN